MFICNILVGYFLRNGPDANYPKYFNYALFIIINIYKIIFETFLYLLITLDSSHNQLDFPHFEVRAYWKITVCFYYIIMIFYFYFKKTKIGDANIFNFFNLLLPYICCTIFILLTRFTQNIDEYSDRFYYLIPLFLEIAFVFSSIGPILSGEKHFLWIINEIDIIRSGLFIIPALPTIILQPRDDKVGCCRCCFEICINYT